MDPRGLDLETAAWVGIRGGKGRPVLAGGGGAGKEVIETGFCTPLYSLKRREETHTHSMVRDICGLGGVGD